jgi:hypothetical protein
MAVKIIKKFDLSKINLDLTKELNLFGQIVRKDHFQRLENGKSVDGGKMKSLKPSTILKKGSAKILVDTGKMRNLVINKASKKNQVVEIHPGKKLIRNGVSNQQIGYYHQTGAGNLPSREWFGISKEAENKGEKLMEHRIEQELNRA